MAYSFEEEEVPTGTLNFQETPLSIVPSPQVAEQRALKADYALGPESPGPAALKSAFLAGDEYTIRTEVANRENLRVLEAKQELISRLARANGRNLSPEEMEVVYSMSANDMRTNPGAILEQKFAEKFISDILQTGLSATAATPSATQKIFEEADVATNVVGQSEWFKNQLHDLEQEWQQTGWLASVPEYLGQLVPFLPWWRQKHALAKRPGIEFLQGSTMAENVQYLWALPFNQRVEEYKRAIEYLKSKNILDALDFARSMVSFPTSDEYLANVVSMADYSTLGSFGAKLGGRFLGKRAADDVAAAVPSEVSVPKEVKSVPTTYTKEASRWEDPRIPPRVETERQLDLFGEQPEQGTFRFMTEPQPPWQTETAPARPEVTMSPTGLTRDRKGRMQRTEPRSALFRDEEGPYSVTKTNRSPEVSPTGIFRDEASGQFRFSTEAYRQRDLPLSGRDPRSPEQGTLDFGPGPGPGPKAPDAPGPTTPPATAVATEVQEARKMLADAVKATEGTVVPTVDETLSAVGKVAEGGFIGALKRVANPLGVGNVEWAKEVPTFANPQAFWNSARYISREYAQRAAVAMTKQGEDLVKIMADAVRGQRLTEEALAVARQRTAEALRKEYGPRTNDAVLDVAYIPAEANPANVETVVLKLGKTNADMFDSLDQARLYKNDIYKLGDGEAVIEQQGSGYYLAVPRHISETDDMVRNALMTPKNSTPVSMVNTLLGWLRSADDLLPKFQNQQRMLAQNPMQAVRKTLANELDKNIGSLSKESKAALNDILRINRDMPSIRYPGERGRWFETAGELEAAWIEKHGRPPTYSEMKAYDTFRRVSDFDWLVRNLAVYRDKARQGVEQFRVRYTSEDGTKSISGWFEGKPHDKMPWNVGSKGEQDAGVWIYNSETGKGQFRYMFDMTDAERKEINELIENKGYKVLQTFDPTTHPLSGIAKRGDGGDLKEQVNYIISNSFERQPLSWHQVDYRPGGHVIYPHQWYVAQAQIQEGRGGKFTYLGDNVAINVSTQAEAKKWAERMDHGRQLLQLGKEAELATYLKANLPHTVDEFKALFFRHDSPFSLTHKIVFKQSGKNTLDTVPELKAMYESGNLVDSTKNVHNLSNFMDKAFLADRDLILKTIKEREGVLTLEAAEQMDPFIAMQRAMNQGLRNLWMNDYKIQAVESWFKEFGHLMKPPEKSLAAHPSYFLYHPQWKSVSEGAAWEELAAAKATQRAIVNFIGANSEIASVQNYLQIKLQDTIYGTLGQGRTLKYLTDAQLGTTLDPVSFLRGAAFHTKLGFFNPVQLFLQMQSINHAIAVSPVHGVPGVAAAFLARYVAHNPAMIGTLDNVASKMGWKAGEFTEMYEAMRRSGLYEVGGEAVLRNELDPQLFRSATGRMMFDKGAVFFNEGERLTRLTGFATAFREWKTTNPGKALTDRAMGEIMDRADLLSVNMTRKSAADWQQGVWSVPTQFFAFNARMMEQFLGKRLTGLEKARALLMYSAMYGVPIGLGTAAGVWPVYDDVKEFAISRGINVSEGYMNVLTEGLYDTFARWVLGKDYNVTERFGPGNNKQIQEILMGDKSFMEVVLGASGTILGDIIASAMPMYYKAASVFTDTGEYPLKASDFLTALRNISTADITVKAYGAAAYGKWYTKTGTSVGPADSMDAVMAVLGLTPQNLVDAYAGQRVLEGDRKSQDYYERQVMENYRRGLQAAGEGDIRGMEEFNTRARVYMELGQFNWEQQSTLYSRAMRQHQDLIDKVNQDLVRKAPMNRQQQRLEKSIRN